MKYLKNYIAASLVLFRLVGIGQQGGLHWHKAGTIPPVGKQPVSPGYAGPVTGIYQNNLLVAGGANFPDGMPWEGGRKKYYDEGFLFQRKGKKIAALGTRIKLPEPIAYSASCGISQGLFYAGGENLLGPGKNSYLINYSSSLKEWQVHKLPDLPYNVTNAMAIGFGSKVYLAGGENADSTLSSFLMLDMDKLAEGWKTLTSMPVTLSHSVISIQNNEQGQPCIFLFGGRRKTSTGISAFSSAVYSYNPANGNWELHPALPFALSAGTGISLNEGQLLLFGGDNGSRFNLTEEMIVAIAKEKDEEIKKSLTLKKQNLQSTHPGFDKRVLLYQVASGSCKIVSEFPFDTPVTTLALRWGNYITIPSGEIRAGVRTPFILLAKMKQR